MAETKNTKSKSAKDDETKTAGKDTSKDTQTTKQAEEKQDDLSTKVEERGETDAEGAASGSVVGGVQDGDTGLDDVDGEKADLLDYEDEVDGVVGTVAERNAKGDEFDVPYLYVTAADVKPRTSDSDDPAKDWTAQHAGGEREDEDGNALDPVALVPVEQTPGQTFRVRELPNRDVAKAAGIDYDQWISGLPVRADVEDEAPRKGIPA
jgi:hypothetical protein